MGLPFVLLLADAGAGRSEIVALVVGDRTNGRVDDG
jgi:hypothetical protein